MKRHTPVTTGIIPQQAARYCLRCRSVVSVAADCCPFCGKRPGLSMGIALFLGALAGAIAGLWFGSVEVFGLVTITLSVGLYWIDDHQRRVPSAVLQRHNDALMERNSG